MAISFIVEDGTGLSNATAYISVDDLKQLWDNYGYDYTSYTDLTLQENINRYTAYLDSTYGMMWSGYRKEDDQALGWPRELAYYADDTTVQIDDDSVPVEVEKAVSELVYGVLTGGADVLPVVDPTGVVTAESVKIAGAIEESKKYDINSINSNGASRIAAVEASLWRILGNKLSKNRLYIQRI